MLVDVILMHVMKMAIVEIVYMAFMPDCGMTAGWAMLVGVVEMVLLGAGHDLFLSYRRRSGCLVIAVPQRVPSRFEPAEQRACRKACNRCVLLLVAV